MADFIPNISYSMSVTIPAGGTTSNDIDLCGHGIVGLSIPSGFNGTTIFLQCSVDNQNYLNIYNKDGTQLQTAVGPNRIVLFTPSDLVGLRFLKLVSNATEASSRTITLMTRVMQ